MARTSHLVKPDRARLLRLEVQRSRRLSPGWMRITLGGGEISGFSPMGYDQWFRLFLPVTSASNLDRIPMKANTLLGYLRYLRIPEGERPIMRNYTVRHYRPATAETGAEIDVDFVLHGIDGHDADGHDADGHGADEHTAAGSAAAWAHAARPGESVVLLDEGLGFDPERGTDRVLLVADETGMPAIAGICASLPEHSRGLALVEAASAADALEFPHPPGLRVRTLVRAHDERPGTRAMAALQATTDAELPPSPLHTWIAGEQWLPTTARRHLVAERGFDKADIAFVGYWRRTP